VTGCGPEEFIDAWDLAGTRHLLANQNTQVVFKNGSRRREEAYFGCEKHFRLRDAPPSPLRYDAIAPKPEAKAEKRRFGATAVRLVTFAATPPATILELACQNTRMQVDLAPFIYLWY